MQRMMVADPPDPSRQHEYAVTWDARKKQQDDHAKFLVAWEKRLIAWEAQVAAREKTINAEFRALKQSAAAMQEQLGQLQ